MGSVIECQVSRQLLGSGGEFLLEVDFSLEKGRSMALFGPSGVGKTSLLRMVAGLMRPDRGRIVVNGEVWFDGKIDLKPQRRKIGFVFQDFALFPKMSVYENLNYASRQKSRSDLLEILNLMDLQGLRDQRPALLSGGQRQRVALARALAQEPELLLLDEPLSALDLEMRERLQDVLIRIQSRYDVTMLMVSHDVSEVFRLCDRVLVLREGRVLKEGSPSQVFEHDVQTDNTLQGKVLSLESMGNTSEAIVQVGHQLVRIKLTSEQLDLGILPGQTIRLELDGAALKIAGD